MKHPLAVAAARVHPWDDVITSAQGIGERLDARLAQVDTLTLDETRTLAAEVDLAHTSCGRTAFAWHRAALARLAARERLLLTGSHEERTINLDPTVLR